ncbi:PDX2 [Scenedesmus sp. PABB004]|nr:PDX2 [Scenedesmus sp. PABB004]
MTSSQPQAGAPPVRIGVLALQGSFREHMALLGQLPGVAVTEVRTREELSGVAGLIIPGGESTTMAHIAESWGLIPELQACRAAARRRRASAPRARAASSAAAAHAVRRAPPLFWQAFARAGKPVWGTCAGMIFLAERAEGQKKGGQALLGGLDICVSRNFFGAQVNSFETQLPAHAELTRFGGEPTFRAVFIRAPAVMEAGPQVEVLAQYTLRPDEAAAQGGRAAVAVAVRQGPLLATAFHPELTRDTRWHQLFVDIVRQNTAAVAAAAADADAAACVKGTRPADLPVYGQEFMSVAHPAREILPAARAHAVPRPAAPALAATARTMLLASRAGGAARCWLRPALPVTSAQQRQVERRRSSGGPAAARRPHGAEFTLSAEDKLEIMELCVRFDDALNGGRQADLGALFAPEPRLTVDPQSPAAPPRTVTGLAPVLEYFAALAPFAAGKRHLTTNVVVAPDGLRAARVRACRLLHAAASPPALLASGVIEDRVVMVDGEWRFEARAFTMDPPAAPPK